MQPTRATTENTPTSKLSLGPSRKPHHRGNRRTDILGVVAVWEGSREALRGF